MKLDLLITGVGGQGIVLASDIIGEAAMAAGYDTKKTDTLGMAQRGGSVVSHVRIGDKVWSPLIKEGDVDILAGFEKLEAVRWGSYLAPGGIAIVNSQSIPPPSVSRGLEHYPTDEEVVDILKQGIERVFLINGTAQAKALGDIRTLNMLMLGCIATFVPFVGVDTWKECICRHLPAKAHEINIKAFDLGQRETQNVCSR
ncbi:MAG: indolepyruvate oxidoreductase subunit beta [Chloroflexi bacterium]|nr:indolepyruvate oxidoreductase subunit beta [Chloroflexota bacterium]